MKDKKIRVSHETMWILGMLLLPLAVAFCTKAGLGMSMIAAPTYIISEKTPLTYGQTEYIFQALVLFLMCVIIRKFKVSYLSSFISALIYGTILDLYIYLLRDFDVTSLAGRIVLLLISTLICAISIACFMKTYLAPCAYDYLVRMVVEIRGVKLKTVKISNDFAYLALSVALSLILFKGKFVGVYWGTLFMALVNGQLISFFSNKLDSCVEFYTRFTKLEKLF